MIASRTFARMPRRSPAPACRAISSFATCWVIVDPPSSARTCIRSRAAARPIVEAHPGLDVLASVTVAWDARTTQDLGRELALTWARAERQVLDAAVPSPVG